MAELAEQFGAQVKLLRSGLSMTQPQLAEAIGMSVEWVRRIEQGQASPSFDTISALAKALGVSPADLFGGQRVARSDQLAALLEGLTEKQAAWLAEGARLLQGR